MHTPTLLAFALQGIVVITQASTNGGAKEAPPHLSQERDISDRCSSAGFGQRTLPVGNGNTYQGNVGAPYGSNIIEIPAHAADVYKYVVHFDVVSDESWTVVIWNKYGPDGMMSGWFGNACHVFHLDDGQSHFFAFDENSQGGWAAGRGSHIPLDIHGGYATTWGEFDFGSGINLGWSGFDVSAIAAQSAQLDVQGMQICDMVTGICSSVSNGAAQIDNAYTIATRDDQGIGGNLPPGPVRLNVHIGYIDGQTQD